MVIWRFRQKDIVRKGAGQLAKKPTRQNCFGQVAKLFWSTRQIPLVNSPNSFGQLAKKIYFMNVINLHLF